jgi:hypothetical protein
MGVNRVVVKDKVFLNNKGLIEDTFDRYTQDKEATSGTSEERQRGTA